MPLWLLERTDPIGYDEYAAHVVAASSEQEARQLVYKTRMHGDEPPTVWLAESTVCTRLTDEGREEIILSSFNAG